MKASAPLQGTDDNQLAADTRILARGPGSHDAYGWRYPDAFAPSPTLMTTRESRSAEAPSLRFNRARGGFATPASPIFQLDFI
jgi:hypothetical protein